MPHSDNHTTRDAVLAASSNTRLFSTAFGVHISTFDMQPGSGWDSTPVPAPGSTASSSVPAHPPPQHACQQPSPAAYAPAPVVAPPPGYPQPAGASTGAAGLPAGPGPEDGPDGSRGVTDTLQQGINVVSAQRVHACTDTHHMHAHACIRNASGHDAAACAML